MGDRTFYRLILPADLPAAALGAAAEAFTEESWSAAAIVELVRLQIGGDVIIDVEERGVGQSRLWAESVREALAEHGQDVAFWVAEDPKYEWLGRRVSWAPELGWHEVDCDAEGNPVITAEVFVTVTAAAISPAAAIAELHRIFGTAWRSSGGRDCVTPAD